MNVFIGVWSETARLSQRSLLRNKKSAWMHLLIMKSEWVWVD